MGEETHQCSVCGANLQGRDIQEGLCRKCREDRILARPPTSSDPRHPAPRPANVPEPADQRAAPAKPEGQAAPTPEIREDGPEVLHPAPSPPLLIRHVCPGCGQAYELAEKAVGRKARCKKCGTLSYVGYPSDRNPLSQAEAPPPFRDSAPVPPGTKREPPLPAGQSASGPGSIEKFLCRIFRAEGRKSLVIRVAALFSLLAILAITLGSLAIKLVLMAIGAGILGLGGGGIVYWVFLSNRLMFLQGRFIYCVITVGLYFFVFLLPLYVFQDKRDMETGITLMVLDQVFAIIVAVGIIMESQMIRGAELAEWFRKLRPEEQAEFRRRMEVQWWRFRERMMEDFNNRSRD